MDYLLMRAEKVPLKEVARSRPLPLCSKMKTKAITLDQYMENYSFPTFIKLDVEGGEAQAIEGAYNSLKEQSPVIAMEVWGGRGWRKIFT